MIRVSALTSGKDVPSARFRVRQHIVPLRSRGIHIREYTPAIDKYAPPPPFLTFSNPTALTLVKAFWKCVKTSVRLPGAIGSWNGDLTWLEREMHPGFLTFEPFLKPPVVLDVDDAIWLTKPFGWRATRKIAKIADVVLAGNHHIADWFSSFAEDVRIVPTAIDTDRVRPRNFQNFERSGRPFIIGWTGTSSNYKALYQIEKALKKFLKSHVAELWVMADQPPRFSELGSDSVRYIKWAPNREIAILGRMDVGLMPLPSDPWSLGKCSFKMLQSMAAGLPVVVSPVGMNAEVMAMGDIGFSAITQDDWYEALDCLCDDSSLAYHYGVNGRRVVENHFSRRVISRILASIFKELS
ncbi:MAG: glycosyltransferase family 4 protein [Nitrospina sp.]|jgi:glycosyltransferase involved in cell wall biosynthesis|nr:glycosyltransferase family 4 protein [Nitrospina sp.]